MIANCLCLKYHYFQKYFHSIELCQSLGILGFYYGEGTIVSWCSKQLWECLEVHQWVKSCYWYESIPSFGQNNTGQFFCATNKYFARKNVNFSQKSFLFWLINVLFTFKNFPHFWTFVPYCLSDKDISFSSLFHMASFFFEY